MRLRALALVAGLVATACGGAAPGPASPPAAAATASPSPAPVKLTVSYSNVISSNLPVWLARDAGIFERNGLDVEAQLIESTKGIPALLTGQVRFAQIGGSEVLSAAVGGGDLVVLGSLVPVWPYQLWVAPSIKSAADLKGKSLAIAGVGGSYDIAMRVALPKIGLQPDKDVTLLATGSVQNAQAAVLSGQLAGTMSQPPDSLILEAKGFYPLVNLAALNLPTANTTIAAQKSWVAANRDVAQRYIDSIVQAIARARKDKPYTLDVLKRWLRSEDAKANEATYDHYVGSVIPALPYPRADQFADAVAQLGQKNEKVRSYDVNSLVDPSFVQSADSRGLHR